MEEDHALCSTEKNLLVALERAHILQRIYEYFTTFCVPAISKSIVHVCQDSVENRMRWRIVGGNEVFRLDERVRTPSPIIDEIITRGIPPLKLYPQLFRFISDYSCYEVVSDQLKGIYVYRLNKRLHSHIMNQVEHLEVKKEQITSRLTDLATAVRSKVQTNLNHLTVNLSILYIHVTGMYQDIMDAQTQFASICARFYRRFIFSNQVIHMLQKLSFSIQMNMDKPHIIPYFVEADQHSKRVNLEMLSAPIYRLYDSYYSKGVPIPNKKHLISFFIYHHVINSIIVPEEDQYLLVLLCNPAFYEVTRKHDYYHIEMDSELLTYYILSLTETFENTIGLFHLASVLRQMTYSTRQSPLLAVRASGMMSPLTRRGSTRTSSPLTACIPESEPHSSTIAPGLCRSPSLASRTPSIGARPQSAFDSPPSPLRASQGDTCECNN